MPAPQPKKNSIAALGVAAFMALTTAIGGPVTLKNEGMRLVPYLDSVGVKTWCGGETEVGYKEKFTYEECSALFLMRYGAFSYAVLYLYDDDAKAVVTPEIHVAMVDTAYNIGLSGLKKSAMMRELNEGRPEPACAAILLYKKAGGRDCSKEKGKPNGCYGVWDRRLRMNKLCLKGV